MRLEVTLVLLVLSLVAPVASQPSGQAVAAVWFVGFSPALPPGDMLAFRLAIAYALDRESVAKAVAPFATNGPVQPAGNIEHPRLASYNPAVRVHSYDPTRAKELFRQSGWTSPISILTGPGRSRLAAAFEGAVSESIRNTIGATVSFPKVANFDVLTSAARSGTVPMFMYGWRSNPRDFGYPSFVLGLAHEYYMTDRDIRALVEGGSAQALEQMLLDKAYLIPIIFYWALLPE